MILIKLTKDSEEFTFDMNNKILPYKTVNVPIQFESRALASSYLTGYMRDQEFEYKFDFVEV